MRRGSNGGAHGRAACGGFTAIELLLSVAIVVTTLGIAIPATSSALEHTRTSTAARYLAGRIVSARLEAVQRSARVALRFERGEGGYTFAAFADGNGNGVRTAEMADGTDPPLTASEQLSAHFAGVELALTGGVPDLDGAVSAADGDGVRIGSARILTLGPDGTATSGTLYLRGRRGQYAVRVLGATGRVRLFQYRPGAREWKAR